eukprot:COSAG06_NODE_1391_length_9606_cov_54.546229_2_plen_120_part_00
MLAGDDVITPLLHHGVAAAVATALLAAKDIGAGVNGSRAGVGKDGERWGLGVVGLELAQNMSEGWYGKEALGEPAAAAGRSEGGNAAASEGNATSWDDNGAVATGLIPPHVVEVRNEPR